jgi:hypothetical protein
MLSTHICLGLPNGVFPFRFPIQVMLISFPQACYIPHIPHRLFDSSNSILLR